MTRRAVWNGTTIAESDDTIVVEGNHYFPPEAVDHKLLRPSQHRTTCGWKGGDAHYYDVVVDGAVNANAAWYYPETNDRARTIEGRIAFWHGVQVEELPPQV